jgi:hypothetical protein
MSNIRNTTLLYKPSLSIWTARKKDKSESQKVNANAGANDGAANVNKQLLPDCAELDAIAKAATAFRNWVYDTTSPWDDSGWRVGSVKGHMDFMSAAGEKMQAMDALVDEFVSAYPSAMAKAQFQLGSMFDYTDYPVAEAVRSKYRFALDCMPLPNADDLRVVEGIEQSEVDRLVAAASNSTEARIAAAMADVLDRLFGVVQKYASTLTQYGNKEIRKFNDTLKSNLEGVIDVLPALNLTNDVRLTMLCDKAKDLLVYDLADLRKDEGVRTAAINDAQAVLDAFNDATAPAIPKPAAVKTTITEPHDEPAIVVKAPPSGFDPASLAGMFGDDE